MSCAELDRTLRWGGAERGEVFAPARSLDIWAGERVQIMVGPDEAALVLEDDEIRSVLLTGEHLVCVLRNGEERGDLNARELAERLDIDVEDVPVVTRRLRTFAPHSRVAYVTLGSLPALSFGHELPTVFRDPRLGAVDLDLEGACRLHVCDPVNFFESFLRNSEDLRPQDFDRIAVALVQGGIGRALESAFEDMDAITRDRDRLAAMAARALSPSLARVGLGVEQLELTRFETPIGLGHDPEDRASGAPNEPRDVVARPTLATPRQPD